MKVGVGIGFLVVNRLTDVIIGNAKRDVEEGELSVGDCVCKLKNRMEVRDKLNIVFQFHEATACDSDDVVDVSLLQLTYKLALVLACYLLLDARCRTCQQVSSDTNVSQRDKHSLGPSYS